MAKYALGGKRRDVDDLGDDLRSADLTDSEHFAN
jgi:hypothetical protein